MKVKNYIMGAFVALATLAGCDEVDEQDRFISMGKVEVKRKVLLEDFTGQLCSNCPKAHEVINNLKAQYGDTVIAVGIHASTQLSIPEPVGLKVPDGDVYLSQWTDAMADGSGLPKGVINRRGEFCDPEKWAAAVRSALTEDSNVQLTLEADTIEGKDSIVVRVHCASGDTRSAKLQLWVTESNITAIQSNLGNVDRQYVHNHVYRAAVNGVGGEAVVLQKDVPSDWERGIRIKSHWKAEELSVVGFIYTEADGVLQVEECKVK